MTAQTFTSAGNEGVIYSLSWSPADFHCIVASTSKNGAFVLDVDKGKVIRRLTEVRVFLELPLLLSISVYSRILIHCHSPPVDIQSFPT